MKKILDDLFISLIITLVILGFNSFIGSFIGTPKWYHYIFALIVLFLVKWLILPWVWKEIKAIKNWVRKKFSKIGILNGSIFDPAKEFRCQKAWTNVTASMWNSELKRNLKTRTKIQMISTSQIDDSFSLIINPFGDIYPEKNTKSHETFDEIKNFIKRGGIFVCTGGAFFSHQDTIHSQESEWVFKRTINGVQSLKESLLYYGFGVETTGDAFVNGTLVMREPTEVEIYQKEGDKIYTGNLSTAIKIKRFRALMPQTSEYIPFIREKNDVSFPVAAVRLGEGYLLHAGIHLESERSNEFKLLIEIIKNLVDSKFKNL